MIGELFLVLGVGALAGFINVNAGGGSFITLPALIFLGLPPAVANGTNRIGILIGALAAARNFKNKGILDIKFGLQLSVPALIGAVIGTYCVISISDAAFKLILSGVMVFVLFVIVFNPITHRINSQALSNAQKIGAMIAFFFVGFYGGFIQAGVGFVIIGSLSLITGLSLVNINSLKVFVVLIFTVFSLGVFVIHGKVNIVIGLVLALGNAIGAHVGSNLSIKKGDKWVRGILIMAVIAIALKLSGIWNIFF